MAAVADLITSDPGVLGEPQFFAARAYRSRVYWTIWKADKHWTSFLTISRP